MRPVGELVLGGALDSDEITVFLHGFKIEMPVLCAAGIEGAVARTAFRLAVEILSDAPARRSSRRE